MAITKSKAPFRADIVGSFLRPAVLKDARVKFEDGKITSEDLKIIEDECIRELVQKEVAAGLQTVTDGEFRRSYWHLDFFWGFLGVEHNVLPHGYFFHDEETRADSVRLTDRVRFNPHHPHLEHFRFLHSIAPEGTTPRQDIPAPAQFYAELFRDTNAEAVARIYGSDTDALVEDIATAYRQTILAFYDLGCRHLKLDDCTWGMLCDREFWNKMAGSGYDADVLQRTYLTVNNKAIENLPADLTITTHVCRGNYHSTYATSGDYEPVAANLFGKENVEAYYLEFDDERSGDFNPLRYLSEGKKVVLGLITTKRPQLEDREQIIQRIREATKFVPLERLCLSPQCGFASTEEGNILTEEEQWRKIALVQEIAKEVWG